MTKVRSRGEQVRGFILDHVQKHPDDIATFAAEHFSISRQAINKHLRKLVEEGALNYVGNTRNRAYKLCNLLEWKKVYSFSENLEEDIVWREDVLPVLGHLPDNVLDIWAYGFTEMFNNAMDHSEGSCVSVAITKTAADAVVTIVDDGVGIFRKIKSALKLTDERHAVLELAKGKLTTDPKHHSGEGIFFSSRAFDDFAIVSGDVHFSHHFGDSDDWIMESKAKKNYGTGVYMKLYNHTSRRLKKIFDQYAGSEDYGFVKTVVPVRLAQYGDDSLISRSQGKRLLSRVDRFKTVILDFKGVHEIGQAFADEVFRVFKSRHPGVDVVPVHTNSAIKRMINRVIDRND